VACRIVAIAVGSRAGLARLADRLIETGEGFGLAHLFLARPASVSSRRIAQNLARLADSLL
jgi:hypothetical protein